MDALLNSQLVRAKAACLELLKLGDQQKQQLLLDLGRMLLQNEAEILRANLLDLARIQPGDPNRDRLMLDHDRILQLAESLTAIASLPDPSGQVQYQTLTPEGLEIRKITVPLGVVGVIYESRPNVTVDVAALCIRSGNVAVMRGGTDAFHTNTCLVKLISAVLESHNLDRAMVQLVAPDRSLMKDLLSASRFIDVVIPRGSQSLIDFVRNNSSIPVIETGAGVCHTYIERTANLQMGVSIAVNAKISRPSVCNSLDTILIDRPVAAEFLRLLSANADFTRVEVFADDAAYELLNDAGFKNLQHAAPEDFGREYLDFKCSVKIVENSAEAFRHIALYSSRHSEAMVSEDKVLQQQFLVETDAAAVYINASTRFTDGAVFGLGAEIGISTQKLHARGPFALEKLVTEKWLVLGSGQTRH